MVAKAKYIVTTKHQSEYHGRPVLVNIDTGDFYLQDDIMPDGTPAIKLFKECIIQKINKYLKLLTVEQLTDLASQLEVVVGKII
jgi:hypothetical protein